MRLRRLTVPLRSAENQKKTIREVLIEIGFARSKYNVVDANLGTYTMCDIAALVMASRQFASVFVRETGRRQDRALHPRQTRARISEFDSCAGISLAR